MDRQRLEAVVDELYGLEPSEFTARRDALATAARKDGDRDLAAAVKGLRRPSAAAYTVNMMARTRSEEIGRLIELGARLREAQAALSGDELRALGRQRQQVVAGLAHEARQLAREAGHPISEATSREVEATFEAALADEKAGEAVRAGRLIRSLEHRGMDPVDLAGAVAGESAGDVDETSTAPPWGTGRASSGAKHSSATRDGAANSAESESAARPDSSRTGSGGEERRRREEAERREAEARARAEAEAAAARAEEAAERAEAAARHAEQRREEAAVEREAAEQRRAEVDEAVQRLEDELSDARRTAEGAAAAEWAARRALRDAEEEAETAAAAARRARAKADALRP